MDFSLSKRFRYGAALPLLLGSTWALAQAPAPQSQAYPMLREQSLSVKLADIVDAYPDLDRLNNGTSNALALNIKPEWLWDFSPSWSGKLRLQGFAATKTVTLDNTEGNGRSNGFVGLRDAWLDYHGWGDYPGESLRFGRERLREPSGLWWDDDVTLARWRLSTSLLQATAGVAEKFSHMRTDNNQLDPDERQIARAFASVRYQWALGQYVGARLMRAQGYGDIAQAQADAGQTASDLDPRLTWLELDADRSYYDWHVHDRWQYEISAAAVKGKDRVSEAVTNGYAVRDRDVNGWAGDVGLRLELMDQPRWVVGAAYAEASGGGSNGDSNAFRPTALASNRSRFTGTRALVYRFGEAYRPHWTNLQVATAYTGLMGAEDWDFNLIYHRYWKQSGAGEVVSDEVSVQPVNQSSDLGQEVDMVTSLYSDADYGWLANSFVRLHGGLFMPGDAYGSGVHHHYRVVVEATKRF